MNDTYKETKSNGEIFQKKGSNSRSLYERQKKAMANLDIIIRNESFRTLVVLSTGGGKKFTAALWLLRNAIARRNKILWIAHR